MSQREGRVDDVPRWLHWIMTIINRVGFPVVVAVYLGYVQLNALAKIVDALNVTNATLTEVRSVIKENSDVMKGVRRGR